MRERGNLVISNLQQQASYLDDTGAADAYVVAFANAPTAYTTGLQVIFKAANTNSGASTINVNGLGIKSIKKNVSTTLSANDILAGQIIGITYDGTNFQMGWQALIDSGVSSGTYTPTFNGVTNLSVINPTQTARYTRVGTIVNVQGAISISPLGAGSTQFSISLPINSNLGAAQDLTGIMTATSALGTAGIISADTASDLGLVTFTALGGAGTIYFDFSYSII